MTRQELVQEHDELSYTPICGGNFVTPVTDRTDYLAEVHYTIGERLFIENAD